MGVNKFNVMSLGKARLLEPEQVGYKDSVDIIYDELNKTRKSFIKIGWYLKHIHDNKMYEQDGYVNIYDLAMEKFRFSQPTTTRYINLCEEFSVNHNSPELDQKYEDYNISQLFEMLSMSKEKIEQVTPAMTVNEIREIKKPSPKAVKTFYEEFIMNTEFADKRESLKQYLIDKFGRTCGGSVCGITYDCSRKGIRLNGSSEITWTNFVKHINDCIPPSVLPDAKDDNIPGQTSIEDDFPEYLPENDYATSHKEQVIEGEYREIDCTEKTSDEDPRFTYGFEKMQFPEKSLEREINNKDLCIEQSEDVQSKPEIELEYVKNVLENEKKELSDYMAYGKFSEKTIMRRRIIVQALEHYLIILEGKDNV